MKAADQLIARLTPNMKESMGAGPGASTLHGGATGAIPPAGGVLHGGAEKYKGAARVRDAFAIEIGRLTPDPDQPRKDFDPDALDDLAASLKSRGQLQPIRVRWDEASSRWIIIAGERRYRAAVRAGLATLLCIEAPGPLTPDDILEDQLVENCLRADLKPIEQAHAFRALLDRRGCSIRQLAESLRISNQSIVRAVALLDLPAEVQGHVEAGELAPSVAYEVSRLEDPEAQATVAARVVAEGLNREEAVAAVREASRPSRSKGRGAKAKKVTARTIRTAAGPKVTVEFRRGLDGALIEAALEQALALVRGTSAEAA